jgi:hypothetical protein
MDQIIEHYTAITLKPNFPANEWDLQLALILHPSAKYQYYKLAAWEWDVVEGSASLGKGDLVFQCDEGNYLVVEVCRGVHFDNRQSS